MSAEMTTLLIFLVHTIKQLMALNPVRYCVFKNGCNSISHPSYCSYITNLTSHQEVGSMSPLLGSGWRVLLVCNQSVAAVMLCYIAEKTRKSPVVSALFVGILEPSSKKPANVGLPNWRDYVRVLWSVVGMSSWLIACISYLACEWVILG